ncbi:unnamed protein product [Phytophthora fragariaefolia]|uniref:Unnamed protein product n=1 Tax=Phytophthora fragariaefolia TaxID=1490495 RepID=A0A9W7CXV2_9STRA|nr:unnamed protein product [Phytophthora fragariaefolia]
MARDIADDLREEAIAAADIDLDEEDTGSTELVELPQADASAATVGDNAAATDTPITTAADTQRGATARSAQLEPADRTKARVQRAPHPSDVASEDRRGDVNDPAGGAVNNEVVDPNYVARIDEADEHQHEPSDGEGRIDALSEEGNDAGSGPVHLPENGVAQGVVDDEIEACERQQQPTADEEDDEPRIYVFAGQGRRGPDSLVSRRPRLTQLRPVETARECCRRRYRTRTGRYVLEFKVERMSEQPDQFVAQKLSINQAEYEGLWRDERMRSDTPNAHGNGGDDEDRSSSDEDGGDVSVANHGAAP